ncbi:hypothetical protein [Brevibacterium atlanticum]|uniref:hypothetical protein n=1 Tax=Brevibacterium atlanticum TaxID=2697563 RepID=UPI0014231476|nr:hypothetical protein [Brevibacterium atlanticum]
MSFLRNFSLASAVISGLILTGCSAHGSDPQPEQEPPESRSYSEPTPSSRESAEDACPEINRTLSTPLQTRHGEINVSLLPVFDGSPNMDDVSYNERQGNYNHALDPHRLILVVVKGRSQTAYTPDPIRDEALTEFVAQPASWTEDGGSRTCADPLATSTRFIGERPADEESDASAIWEIRSHTDIYAKNSLMVTVDVLGQDLVGLNTPYAKRPAHSDDAASTAKKEPAFADLSFYYENR